MIIGSMLVELRLHGTSSLKEKRQILKSLIARVQNRFHVSVAEVAQNDRWEWGSIGVAVVSNDATHARQMLETISRFIEADHLGVEVTHSEIAVEHAL